MSFWPMDASEFALELETDSGRLSGTLLCPHTVRKVPVLLLIAGSGPTDRDGNSSLIKGKNNSLKLLAEAQAHMEFASLRFDKRGIGQSALAAKAEKDLRFEHYVQDAAGWLLATRRFSLHLKTGIKSRASSPS